VVAREVRQRDDPGARVRGHVELGHDADAAQRGVADDLFDVVGGEELAVARGTGGEVGVGARVDANALVVGDVEVEDVEFGGGERVDGAQNERERHPVPHHVEHDAAPRKARAVANGDDRNDKGGRVARRPHELKQRLERVTRAKGRGGLDFDVRGDVVVVRDDAQRVGLVDAQLGILAHGVDTRRHVVHDDADETFAARRRVGARRGRQRQVARESSQLRQKAPTRLLQHVRSFHSGMACD
jgi:hypothetical protein